ncbi:MAG TPA: cytochrome c [Bryobacteraceae bacterium]|nr:cytochrome c [Bryobacteraceae bacterium]
MKVLGLALAVSLATSAAAVTFNRDVLPILEKKCQSCHRPGEVAPMSLLTYETSRPWAKAIKSAVLTKKMPPWSADPRYGHFVNDPTLTAEEVRILAEWADSGAPEGNAVDAREPSKWPDGWAIQPDVVLSLPHPIPVPAKGALEVMDIPIPSGFTKDTWVTSIEIRPGDRSVVHHADVFIVPHRKDVKYGVPEFEPKARDADGVQIEKMEKEKPKRGLLGLDAIYVPGAPPDDYRLHGAAKLVPAGSDFIIQMHYTPNGTATTDQTRVGFTIAKEKPARQLVTIVPTAPRDAAHFHIPAGDPNWEARAEVVFLQDADLVWFLPHMHLRGKDMTYQLIYPSGVSVTVLSVKYDFNWQLAYDVKTPIAVPKGTRLQAVAHYDNSANNRFNPDPSKEVWWGDQTMEEMMVPYFGVLVKPGVKHNKIVAYSTASDAVK